MALLFYLIIRTFYFFSRNSIFLLQQISRNSVSAYFFSEANGAGCGFPQKNIQLWLIGLFALCTGWDCNCAWCYFNLSFQLPFPTYIELVYTVWFDLQLLRIENVVLTCAICFTCCIGERF